MYPGRLGDRYTGLGAQTLAPQKTLFKSSFFSCTSTKIALNSSDQWFEISKLLKRQKNADRREKQWNKKTSKRKKKLATKVFSFIYIRNRSRKCSLFLLDFFTNLLPLIIWCKKFTLLPVIPSVLLAASFQLRSFRSSSQVDSYTKVFIRIYEFF